MTAIPTKTFSYPTYPPTVSLDLFGFCNGKCVFCPYPDLKHGKMSDELFHKCVDEIRGWNVLTKMVPHFYGEPFLNPDLIKSLKYIEDNVELSRIEMFTNGSLLDDDKLDEFVKISNIQSIGFSVYANDPKTYADMMGLPFETISKIEHAIKRLEVERPDIHTFVAFTSDPFYLHQSEIKTMYERWGSRSGDHVMVHTIETPTYVKTREYPNPCLNLFLGQLIIRSDGTSPLCCFDPACKFIVGDANKERLIDIWNGKKLQTVRSLHMDGLRKTHPLCGACTYNLEYFG